MVDHTDGGDNGRLYAHRFLEHEGKEEIFADLAVVAIALSCNGSKVSGQIRIPFQLGTYAIDRVHNKSSHRQLEGGWEQRYEMARSLNRAEENIRIRSIDKQTRSHMLI